MLAEEDCTIECMEYAILIILPCVTTANVIFIREAWHVNKQLSFSQRSLINRTDCFDYIHGIRLLKNHFSIFYTASISSIHST